MSIIRDYLDGQFRNEKKEEVGIGGFTALALLVDDLSMPMRGGESVVANKSLEVMHTINKPVDSMLGFMKNMFNGGGKVEQNVVVEVKSTDPERSAIEVRDKLQEHLEIAKALVQGGGM